MIESNFHFHRKYSYTIKKTKEEQEKEIAGLPKNIGPYEIIEKLKDGGYSKIYKAKSCYTGDFVAIKAIDKMGFQESVEDVLLMIRQTEVLKILKHRNILSLYEIYESTKYFYLVMDYLPNGDLIEKIIKQKRFKEEEALSIFSQLVDALFYMHKNDICHRDIRTEKILFDKNNKPKIVGFSYSAFYTQGKKIRDSYGSLCYACPEIIQNDYYNPELADVWSLGVVLYVMICGYLPFSEDDDDKNKELIINGEVDYPPEISNKVKDLLKHMLDKDPNKRYNFQRIIKHPWFKPYNEATMTGGCNIYKMIYPIDERILKIIVIYGFKKNEIDMDLKQNKFNMGTGLYKQLTDKFLNMGFISNSDLCSEDFLQFRNDKENMITDGDKKYKKYITKILDKIKKVERYVNEYKRKEDKVVRDLESIYADAQAEEIKIQKQKEKELMKINNLEKMKNLNHLNTININDKNFQRRTLSPMLTVKEQKGIKDYLASKIGYIKKDKKLKNSRKINDNYNQNNDDLDILKKFHDNNKINEINNILNFDEDENEDFNTIFRKRSASNPNIKEFVQNLIDKEDEYCLLSSRINDNSKMEENDLRPPKRKRQLSVMIKKKKKNYLNTSSINDSFLRRPKGEKERKRNIKDKLIGSIKQVIIEENFNEANTERNNNEKNGNKFSFNDDMTNDNKDNPQINDNKEEDKEIIKVETKKSKNIRYSLSFGDEDEDIDEESGFISKIDSKQVSMYDIDEELKELKEIKNTLKSPVCGPYLKPHTSDNKLFNFNIDNNSTIFGEHLDENNITNNTNATQIANINEKIDILTQLKKITEKNSTELAKSKYDNDSQSKRIENNQFKEDSFGENPEYRHEYSPIVFDDHLEISFHDENNNIKNHNNSNNTSNKNLNIQNSINTNCGFNNYNSNNNNYIDELTSFIIDKNTIKKMYEFNKAYEFMLSVTYVNSKRENKFCHKFIKDLFTCKKLNIYNSNKDLNINIIESKRSGTQKNNNKNNKEKNKIVNSKMKKRIEKENIKNILNKNTNKEKENNQIKSVNNKKNKKIKLNKVENLTNTSIENSNKNLSTNKNSSNDLQNNYINSNFEKYGTINPLLNSQYNPSNFNNFFNNDDSENPKIYIIDNIDNFDSFNDNNNSIKNESYKNNIIINSNNNTINNISINNKNNFENYYGQSSINNNKYYNIESSKKNQNNNNNKNKLDWTNLTNTFKSESKKLKNPPNTFYSKEKPKVKSRNENKGKNELFSLNTDKNSTKYKSNKKVNNYSNIYSNILLTNNSSLINRNNVSNFHKYNKSDLQGSLNHNLTKNKMPVSSKKNLLLKKEPKTNKKKNTHISIEKALHSNLMSNNFENSEDKKEFISKVKKGQKIYQYITKDKNNLKHNSNYYNKFINTNDSKKNIKEKKPKTNYVEQYHKRVNSTINNNLNKFNHINYSNKKEMEDSQEKYKHNKTRSDMINYDYLFSIYNEMNKNNNLINSVSKSPKKRHAKNQSMDNYFQTSIKEEEISFGKNEFDDNNFLSTSNRKLNLKYGIGNDVSIIEKNE